MYKKSSVFDMKRNKLNDNRHKNQNIADNMILSHLSSKRKEYNIERFEKIFDKFDKMLDELTSTFAK